MKSLLAFFARFMFFMALLMPHLHVHAQNIDVPDHIMEAVNHPARLAQDRELDSARKYPQMLGFLGIEPGMILLDVFGAHGITTEVLARSVGVSGKVYLHNPPWYYERFGNELLGPHLENNRLPNVEVVVSPFSEIPLAPDSLDGVVLNMIFHDIFWLEPDGVRDHVADLYDLVKPGGFVGIVDHAAPPGFEDRLANKNEGDLHRLDEAFTRRMFLEAGFVLVAESDALRNPLDNRTTRALESPIFHGNTDRFLLKFLKPR